jgi:hypothetical protein
MTTYEASGSVQVGRRVCGAHTYHIRGCFDNSDGHLPSQLGSRVCELANYLRLGIVVLSQDLTGVWITMCE